MRSLFVGIVAAAGGLAVLPATWADEAAIHADSGVELLPSALAPVGRAPSAVPPSSFLAGLGANLATPPSSARGAEITLAEEALTSLPEANLPPPTLYPTTTVAATTAPPRSESERRGHAALAQLSYDWQARLPGWEIDFLPGRSGVIGLTFVSKQHIEVYVRSNMSDSLLAHVVAHELGHAVDVTLNTGPEREAWQHIRGIGSAVWWPGDGATDFSTGAGDFAESFAYWQLPSSHFRSNLSGPPDQPELDLMAELATG